MDVVLTGGMILLNGGCENESGHGLYVWREGFHDTFVRTRLVFHPCIPPSVETLPGNLQSVRKLCQPRPQNMLASMLRTEG